MSWKLFGAFVLGFATVLSGENTKSLDILSELEDLFEQREINAEDKSLSGLSKLQIYNEGKKMKDEYMARATAPLESPPPAQMPTSNLETDGWKMVFRAQSGNGNEVYGAWLNGRAVATVKPPFVGRSYSAHYRDPRVAQWNSLQVRQVKFGLYFENREVAFIIFNGLGTTSTDWFDKSRVIVSSYSDLTPSGTFNYFSVEGHTIANVHHRRFFVNKLYAGCPGDLGWLDVADVGTVTPCHIDKHAVLPQFLYSTINGADFWEKGMYGRADYMAIFVKTV